MTNLAIVLPCAILGAICGISLIFIWWWFPRTWRKGTEQEIELVMADRRAAQRVLAGAEDRERALNDSEIDPATGRKKTKGLFGGFSSAAY